jgi:hypothetical protein
MQHNIVGQILLQYRQIENVLLYNILIKVHKKLKI